MDDSHALRKAHLFLLPRLPGSFFFMRYFTYEVQTSRPLQMLHFFKKNTGVDWTNCVNVQ